MSDWKKTEIYKARLLRYGDDFVWLEFKIDDTFQERVFDADLFSDFNLEKCSFFLVVFSKRPGAFMFEIVDGTGKVSEADFENVDLTEIKESPIFKH